MRSDYSYTRYLLAKRTVDDRALNKDVFAHLRREVVSRARRRCIVVEIGAGLGTMVARLIEWDLVEHADYTLIDVDPKLLEDSRNWLDEWARAKDLQVDRKADELRVFGRDRDWTVRFVEQELGTYLDIHVDPLNADLLIANAVLDLLDVPIALPQLLRHLAPDGLYWFSINFDGDTIFEPGHPLDDHFMQVYHRSMDRRIRYGRRAGDSKTGRHLFRHLQNAGAEVLAAGASDWIVFPTNGRYPAEEAVFLEHILHTVEEELRGHADVDLGALTEWVETRCLQIGRGELVYIAHQLDVCGCQRRRPLGAIPAGK